MKRILMLAVALLWLAIAASAQKFEIVKMQLGFENSASALFTCDDFRTHYSHILVEQLSRKESLLTLYSVDRPSASPNNNHIYQMRKRKPQTPGEKAYNLSRTSPNGCQWKIATIETKGNMAVITLRNAFDRWDGKIFYVFTARIAN